MRFSHPRKVCMTYREHFSFSFNLGIEFAKASFFAFIHAIFPDYFITYSSDSVTKIQNLINSTGCKN